jgi:universal stress protein A
MTAPPISMQSLLFADVDSVRPARAAIREIVFASDLSSASDRAFDHARLLAEGFGAHLVLYHALAVAHGTVDPDELEIRHRVQRAAREHLERRAQGTSVATDVRVERCPSVSDALVSYLLAARPDLVVMGTRGRGSLAHLVLGSVAESVLQRARMPTLCVREPEHGVAVPYRRLLVPSDLSPSSCCPGSSLWSRDPGHLCRRPSRSRRDVAHHRHAGGPFAYRAAGGGLHTHGDA